MPGQIPTAVRFAGSMCLETRSILQDLGDWNATHPDLKLDTVAVGKANSFRWGIGQTPGQGFVLLKRSDLERLVDGGSIGNQPPPGEPASIPPPSTNSISGFYDLEFEHDNHVVKLPRLLIVRAIRVTIGGLTDPDSVYLVELADRRYLCRYSTLTKTAFNVQRPEKDFYQYSLDGSDPWTWARMVEEIWNSCNVGGHLGPFTELPIEPDGQPINFEFANGNAWDALGCVLNRLGMYVNWKPAADTFQIVLGGDGGDYALDAAFDNNQFFLVDAEPVENLWAKLPSEIRVQFHNCDWMYCDDSTTPTAQEAYRHKSTHHIDLPANPQGGAGTRGILWDDMRALYDPFGVIQNEGELNARAAQRVIDFVNDAMVGTALFRRVYSGHCNGDFVPHGKLTGVAYHSFGDGLKTTVIRKQLPIQDHATEWATCDCSYDCDTLKPPSYPRPTMPFTRLAWARLIDPIEPEQCGRASVMVYVGDEASCGPWDVCTDTIVMVQDVIGARYQPGQKLLIYWHWQGYRWTIVAGGGEGGGGEGGFWAWLMDRAGGAYTWKEATPVGNCQFALGQRHGELNAFDVNCSSHNSQNGLNPLVVWMRGPYFTFGSNIEFFLFDYAGTNELDEERFSYTP